MKSAGMWVADSQEAYAKAFMEYVNLKKNHLFQVRVCTDEEQLKKLLSDEEIEILLITAEWYEAFRELIHQKSVIILSEGSVSGDIGSCPAVYKYQSVENILREVMFYYSEQDSERACTGVRRDTRVIGVFSPCGGAGKTVFALTLGEILAEKENQNVLYLNLEECSGIAGYLGGGHWNASDLIYFLRQNKAQFLYRLNSMIQKLDRLDYIPPCESYTDFCQITAQEWQRLLQLIRTQTHYDSVILDLGNVMGHEAELLRQCDGIYVPVRQDMISRAKVDQYEMYLQILDGLDILEKMQKLELPACGSVLESTEDLLMLRQRETGVYIRELLKE